MSSFKFMEVCPTDSQVIQCCRLSGSNL